MESRSKDIRNFGRTYVLITYSYIFNMYWKVLIDWALLLTPKLTIDKCKFLIMIVCTSFWLLRMCQAVKARHPHLNHWNSVVFEFMFSP